MLWNLEQKHWAEIRASKEKARSFTEPRQWTDLAEKQKQEKEFDKALQSYKEALKLDPSFYRAWDGLGKTYETIGRFDKATALYKEALETFPGSAPVWKSRILFTAGLESLESGQIPAAISKFKQALLEYPGLDRAWFRLADAYNHGKRVVYHGKPWDFYFKQTDLKKVLIFIARLAELNMVIHQGTAGTVTCELDQVKWDKALDLFLKINDAGKCRVGDIYLIGRASLLQRFITAGKTALNTYVKKKTSSAKPVDLSFFDADIHYALQTIAAQAGSKIILDPGINNSITCELKRVPWDTAIDVLLPMNDLTSFRLGNLVRVGKTADMERLVSHEAGMMELLQSLLQLDPGQVHFKDERGKTVLFFAAEKGYAQLARYLISLGSRVNERDKWNFTPLHEAANPETAEVLTASGALLNVQANSGQSPLQTAVYGFRLETARFLVEKGAITNIFLDAAIGRLEQIHKQVSKNPALVNSIGMGGWTPLHHAVVTGQYQTVEFLLSKNADINAVTLKGETPLHLAVSRGYTRLVKLLIMNRARVKEKDKFGQTPLNIARANGKPEIIKLLEKYGGRE